MFLIETLRIRCRYQFPWIKDSRFFLPVKNLQLYTEVYGMKPNHNAIFINEKKFNMVEQTTALNSECHKHSGMKLIYWYLNIRSTASLGDLTVA